MLKESKPQYIARFLSNERKVELNRDLKSKNIQFMKEYLKLGHMVPTSNTKKGRYYLLHYAIVSLTFKARVVFDASAKSSNGYNFNDIMLTDPKLQCDIFEIILKCSF